MSHTLICLCFYSYKYLSLDSFQSLPNSFHQHSPFTSALQYCLLPMSSAHAPPITLFAWFKVAVSAPCMSLKFTMVNFHLLASVV